MDGEMYINALTDAWVRHAGGPAQALKQLDSHRRMVRMIQMMIVLEHEPFEMDDEVVRLESWIDSVQKS